MQVLVMRIFNTYYQFQLGSITGLFVRNYSKLVLFYETSDFILRDGLLWQIQRADWIEMMWLL